MLKINEIKKFQSRGFGGWILTIETDGNHPIYAMTPRSFEEFTTIDGDPCLPIGETPACTDTDWLIKEFLDHLGITEKKFFDWLDDKWSDELEI